MKYLFLLLLFIPLTAKAEMLNVPPLTHALIAAAATYSLTDLCEIHLTQIAEHCQWIVPALVIGYAVWEYNSLRPGFERQSVYADFAGVGFAIVVYRW